MKRKSYILMVLVLIMIIRISPSVWAEKNTVMAGVDDDQLFAGAWFALTPKLDMMLQLYDNSKIGWGFDYLDGNKAFKLSSEWKEYQAMFKTANGAFHYNQNDVSGTNSGGINWNFDDLGVTGYYSTNEDSYQNGSLNAKWDGEVWNSQLHSGYRHNKPEGKSTKDETTENETQDEGAQNNYGFLNSFQTKIGKWSLDVEDNMFSEGEHYLIGEGVELAWLSPAEHWQIALGQFHDSKTDLTDERLQFKWMDKYEKQFEQNVLGCDTTITEDQYGNGDMQHIGDFTGWWRYDFEHGSLKWNLENIWSAGETPFEFDDEDDHSFYTGAEFDWRSTYHSNFTIKYDLSTSEWRNVHGLLEVPLGNWIGSLTANYDFAAEYGDSELVYLFMVTSPTGNFSVGQSLNHQFGNLDTDLEWKISFASSDQFQVKFAYDWEDSKLDTLLLRYNVIDIGTFTLTYDLDKPKVMLVYSWGVISKDETINKRRGSESNYLD